MVGVWTPLLAPPRPPENGTEVRENSRKPPFLSKNGSEGSKKPKIYGIIGNPIGIGKDFFQIFAQITWDLGGFLPYTGPTFRKKHEPAVPRVSTFLAHFWSNLVKIDKKGNPLRNLSKKGSKMIKKGVISLVITASPPILGRRSRDSYRIRVFIKVRGRFIGVWSCHPRIGPGPHSKTHTFGVFLGSRTS